ncbi:MAG TPA: hypothetical protein DD738_06405 [Ruminiclostridium sp.]|jgi:hypothetical protein|nr:hypothetical protein [Ruminiclostridium sp.]
MKPSAIIAKTIPFMPIRFLAYLIFFIGICIYAAIVVFIINAIQPEGFFAFLIFALFAGGGWDLYRLAREPLGFIPGVK